MKGKTIKEQVKYLIENGTNKIQLWNPDTMAGLITKKEAISLIENGKYFVINCQAICFKYELLAV